jgi:hypothetical protein
MGCFLPDSPTNSIIPQIGSYYKPKVLADEYDIVYKRSVQFGACGV